MRKLYKLFMFGGLAIASSFQLNAQCVADAGGDLTICDPSVPGDYMLGGNPASVGTIAPEYTWSMTFFDATGTYHASDFLDDTTLANPTFIGFPSMTDSILFHLDVLDPQLVPLTCSDSMYLTFSEFAYTGVSQFASVSEGDTVKIHANVVGGFGEKTIVWSPDYNISDVNDFHPDVFPTVDTMYTYVVTDAGGCVADTGYFTVNVFPLSLEELELNSIANYPNPFTNHTTIELNNSAGEMLTVEVFSSVGQLVHSLETDLKTIQIGEALMPGTYIVVISAQNQVKSRGSIQKL